jgi:hypothetical protein
MSRSVLIINRWLTVLLALVIALQSLAAIGDTSRPHYPATLDHAHEDLVLNSVTLGMEESSSSDPSRDHVSDHCHQNHSHCHMVLVSAASNISILSAGQGLSDYQASHTSVIPPSLFRPPIA